MPTPAVDQAALLRMIALAFKTFEHVERLGEAGGARSHRGMV